MNALLLYKFTYIRLTNSRTRFLQKCCGIMFLEYIYIYDFPYQKEKEKNKEEKKSEQLMQKHLLNCPKVAKAFSSQPDHFISSHRNHSRVLQNKANSDYIIMQHCFKMKEIQQYNSWVVTTSAHFFSAFFFFLVCDLLFTFIHVFSSPLVEEVYTAMNRVFLERKIITFSR